MQATEAPYGKARHVTSLVQLHTGEGLRGPRTEAVQRKLRLLSGLDVNKDVVVFLLRTLALPILIERVVRWNLDVRAARQDRILLGAATAEQHVFHAVHVVNLGRVHVSVEDDDVEVLRVRCQNRVGILSFRNGPHTGAREGRVVEGDEHLASASGLRFIQPPSQLLHLYFIGWPGSIPGRGSAIVVFACPEKNETSPVEIKLVGELLVRYAE